MKNFERIQQAKQIAGINEEVHTCKKWRSLGRTVKGDQHFLVDVILYQNTAKKGEKPNYQPFVAHLFSYGQTEINPELLEQANKILSQSKASKSSRTKANKTA